jgi:Rps23 Pro-64 3,4-dihydroxylase Tpa1-like proline 4-hydroxylase
MAASLKRPRPSGPSSSRPLKLAAKAAADKASAISYVPKQGEKASSTPEMLNPMLLNADLLGTLKCEYESSTPFPHMRLHEFCDESFLETVRAELATISYHVKANDLYEFFQSDDLKSISEATHPAIATLRETLYGKTFVSAISEITGIELDSSVVDMSAAVYKRGSYLACHDDHNNTRRVAFIIYLVDKEWQTEDGGALDLFNKNTNDGHPSEVAKKLVPAWNSFAMFAVTPDSWHRVAEVVSDTKPRITISGWFHGERKDRPKPPPKPLLKHSLMDILPDPEDAGKEESKPVNFPVEKPEVPVGTVKLSDFITSQYLLPDTMGEVNAHFCRHSSYMLRDCFRKEAFDELMFALHGTTEGAHKGGCGDGNAATSQLWERAPCPQREWHFRACCKAPNESMSAVPRGSDQAIVGKWRRLFLSPEFGAWLRELTSLTAISGSFEARKFDRGHYTLLDDSQFEHPMMLDVVLGCSKKEHVWAEPHGGYVCYMADEEELLTVPLESNALFLVLRDDGCGRFVKYVNVRAPGSRCDLSAEYAIAPLEDTKGEQSASGSSESDEDDYNSDTDEKTMGYGAQAAMIAGHHMG